MRRRLIAGVLLISSLVGTPASVPGQIEAAGLRGPQYTDPTGLEEPASVRERFGPASVLVRGLFALYQRKVSPTKGARCPMVPSCSEYGRLCLARHGLLRGTVMSAERLHRCGHDLYRYPKLWSATRGWCYDNPPY